MEVVELLQTRHDRKSFRCGKAALDDFLHRLARQHADRNLGVTQVVVPEAFSRRIVGYYTLVTRTVDRALFATGSLPAGPVGVVLLGRLAVDSGWQGNGLGKRMLLRAIRQTEEAARVIGVFALVVDALDEDARGWYLSLGWGFEELLDSPRHLFLPVDTIRRLGL